MSKTKSEQRLEQSVAESYEAVESVLDGLSDEVPVMDIDEELTEEEESMKKTASDFLNAFKTYITSSDFSDQCNRMGEKYRVPPKKVAKNFIAKVLGVLGDALGIVINTGANIAHTVIDVISLVLHSGVDIIVKAARGISRVVTCNQTAVGLTY